MVGCHGVFFCGFGAIALKGICGSDEIINFTVGHLSVLLRLVEHNNAFPSYHGLVQMICTVYTNIGLRWLIIGIMPWLCPAQTSAPCLNRIAASLKFCPPHPGSYCRKFEETKRRTRQLDGQAILQTVCKVKNGIGHSNPDVKV